MSFVELEIIQGFMERAVCPEDVFGDVGADGDLRHSFAKLAKALHPDVHEGDAKAKELAGKLFAELEQFRDEARKRMHTKTYGRRIPMPGRAPIVIANKYVRERSFKAGDIADLHVAHLESSASSAPLILKVARHPQDNDLIRTEASAIEKVRAKLPERSWRQTVPRVVDSFLLDDGSSRRRCNVMEEFAGFYDCEEIRAKLPGGVDGRTVAWMWKRLLVLMEWVHRTGYIHGAILPPHVMFYPDNGNAGKDQRKHSVRLVDWCYAVEYKNRTRLSAWLPRYKGFYAPEIIAKRPLGPWTDLYMAAMTMLYVAGAAISESGAVTLNNGTLPQTIKTTLLQAVQKEPLERPRDIGAYFDEFQALLLKEYGRPKWHEFVLP